LVRTNNTRIPTLLQDTFWLTKQSFVDTEGTKIRDDATKQNGLHIIVADAAATTDDDDDDDDDDYDDDKVNRK
jgi:hypothetical protein